MVQKYNLQDKVFACIVTYGKAMGMHGASILGGHKLISYLINFCRPFIYTTAMALHSAVSIRMAYERLNNVNRLQQKLFDKVLYFKEKIKILGLDSNFISSDSPIQCLVIGDNHKTKNICKQLQDECIGVVPILYPTVQRNAQRIRFCLHTFNTKKEIDFLCEKLSKILFQL